MRKTLLFAIFSSLVGAALAADGPAGYPATLMDAPATLSEPPAAFVRLGKPVVALEKTELEDVLRLWLIATDGPRVSEAQLEWLPEKAAPDPVCRSLPPQLLPVRLGKVGLGMTQIDLRKLLGTPSLVAADGWHYWFSQRFLRDDRHFQILELNWLGVRFEDNRAVRVFSSQVTNP